MAKFNIEDNFFIIDSNNLEDIKTKLYGYCISEYSNHIDYLDSKINLNGLGCYVYLYVHEDKITVNQDFNGCYGIYLFQDKDYFALSNSFMYLVDYIKTKYKITLNRDYANYLLIAGLCSEIYEKTIINEITMISRNAVIEINKRNKTIKIDYIDYKENTIELGSDECFDILDNWYYRWINIIKSIKLKTNNFTTDLSGGMDSRLVLLLFLGSGIDLNQIQIKSYTDGLICHGEDFEIASEIANDYKFKLNNKNINIKQSLFSLEDTINISFYTKLCFHKQMYFKLNENNEIIYRFCGGGGECIRAYYNYSSILEFIKDKQKKIKIFLKNDDLDMNKSLDKVINESFSQIIKNTMLKKFDDSDLFLNLYRETRCRNHFGKAYVEDYISHMISISPFFDPELQKLKLASKECLDRTTLYSLIFTRYCPNLLNYKIEGKRIINKNTIEFAQKINSIKPFKKNNFFKKEYKIIKSFDLYPKKYYEEKNIVTKDELTPCDFLLNIFNSDKFKYLFTIYYNKSILDAIDIDIKKRKYHPLLHAYAVIGITKIISDVIISEKILNSDTIFNEIQNFTNNEQRIYDYCKCTYSLNEQLQQKNEQLQQKNEQIKNKNEQLQQKNEAIQQRDEAIKNKNSAINQKNNEIQNLHKQNNIIEQAIKQLQNSWSYRIGRLFTYPLSIFINFYKYIRDYNLIKKSGLFDSEYYLLQNKDVKKSNINPIKHYLQFGWKEGRNPSEKFDGNEYLNKRPDVRLADICPLVHYIKFGKEE